MLRWVGGSSVSHMLRGLGWGWVGGSATHMLRQLGWNASHNMLGWVGGCVS